MSKFVERGFKTIIYLDRPYDKIKEPAPEYIYTGPDGRTFIDYVNLKPKFLKFLACYGITQIPKVNPRVKKGTIRIKGVELKKDEEYGEYAYVYISANKETAAKIYNKTLKPFFTKNKYKIDRHDCVPLMEKSTPEPDCHKGSVLDPKWATTPKQRIEQPIVAT